MLEERQHLLDAGGGQLVVPEGDVDSFIGGVLPTESVEGIFVDVGDVVGRKID